MVKCGDGPIIPGPNKSEFQKNETHAMIRVWFQGMVDILSLFPALVEGLGKRKQMVEKVQH